MIRRALTIVVLLLAVSGPAAADFEEGLAAYERFDYTAALAEWRSLAEQGDARAQFYLGEMLRQGRGLRRDVAEAADWYRKASMQGYAEAQLQLAELYDTGRGVERDLAEAARWLQAAASQGNAEAMHRLGRRYASGEGVTRDLVQAHKWLALAVAHGGNVVGFLARSDLRNVKGQMTPAEVREAEQLTRDWEPERSTRIGGATEEPEEALGAGPAG